MRSFGHEIKYKLSHNSLSADWPQWIMVGRTVRSVSDPRNIQGNYGEHPVSVLQTEAAQSFQNNNEPEGFKSPNSGFRVLWSQVKTQTMWTTEDHFKVLLFETVWWFCLMSCCFCGHLQSLNHWVILSASEQLFSLSYRDWWETERQGIGPNTRTYWLDKKFNPTSSIQGGGGVHPLILLLVSSFVPPVILLTLSCQCIIQVSVNSRKCYYR